MAVKDQGRLAAQQAYRKFKGYDFAIEDALAILRAVDLEKTIYTRHIPQVIGRLEALLELDRLAIDRLAAMAASDDWMGLRDRPD